MRVLALSAYLLIPCLGAEVYTPRFSQVTSDGTYYSQWEIQDTDGDGLPDLTNVPKYGLDSYRGAVVRNLGNRSFAPSEISHHIEAEAPYQDTSTHYTQLDEDPELELYFSLWSYPTGKYTPMMVNPGKPGQYGQRVPLAPEGDELWYPVDIDADQQTEFLSCSPNAPARAHLRLWEKQVDGTYTSVDLPLGGEIGFFDNATAVDMDDDGDLDLLLSNSDEMWVIKRTGIRSFAATSASIESDRLSSPAWSDLDGDGLPEMHSVTPNTNFEWRDNLGSLSFSEEKHLSSIIPALEDWKAIKVETFDGAPAILHLTQQSGSKILYKSIRFGTWEILSDLTIPTSHLGTLPEDEKWEIALEDLDKDGILDFAVSLRLRPETKALAESGTFSRLAIAWGTSIGFESAAFIDPPPLTHKITRIDDFNGDGSKDLLLGPDVIGRFALLPNTGDGTFGPPRYLTEIAPPAGSPSGTYVSAVHSADFNGDSIPDLAIDYTAPLFYSYRNASGIALGNGDGTFTPPSLPAGSFDTITNGALNISQLIDWDKDGDLDAISGGAIRENLGGYFSQEIRPLIETAYGTDSFGNPVKLDQTYAGDVDGDGFPDIIALSHEIISTTPGIISPSAIVTTMGIGYNDGQGGIGSIVVSPIDLTDTDLFGNSKQGRLLLADMNEDGLLDLFTTEYATTDIFGNPVMTNRWRRNPGNGSRNPADWTKLPLGPPGSPVPQGPKMDFNGDGILEWVNPTGYLRPTPQGPVLSPTYRFTGKAYFGYQSVNFAEDFDGDGDADFLIGDNHTTLILVKNPTVDERSAITRHLVKDGVKGSMAGPAADADGDGRSNEAELLFGTDPTLADLQTGNSLTMSLAYQPGGSSLGFRKPAYAEELNLQYQVEHSTNLQDWNPIDGVSPTRLSKDASWEHLTLPLSCSGPCGFYRVTGSHQIDAE